MRIKYIMLMAAVATALTAVAQTSFSEATEVFVIHSSGNHIEMGTDGADKLSPAKLDQLREALTKANGWEKCVNLGDASQYFFAIYEHDTDTGLVLGTGNRQGSSYQTLWYQSDVYPEVNKRAIFTIDGFDSNHNPIKFNLTAVPQYAVITCAGYPDVCLQSNDAPNEWTYRTENNGEGWVDRAYIVAGYATMPDASWRLCNRDGFLGRYDGSDEICGNNTIDDAGHFDIYAILRGNYVAAAENIAKASEDNAIDISYVITNADGTRYNNFHAKQPVGWTLSQEDAFEVEYANYLPAKVGDSYFNKWQGSGNLTNRSMSQQLTGLPNGTYRLSVRTSTSVIHAGAFLVANDQKADMTKLQNSTASIKAEVTDGTLTIGVELKNYTSNDCKFDHFTLEYLGGAINGINDQKSQTANLKPQIYDLTGRRLNQPQKGINIIDGKKKVF